MQQYVIFNVLKEYCIPKEEEEDPPVRFIPWKTIYNYVSQTFLSELLRYVS